MQTNKELKEAIKTILEKNNLFLSITDEFREKYNGFTYGDFLDYVTVHNPKFVNFILEISKSRRDFIICDHILYYRDNNIKDTIMPNLEMYSEYLPQINQIYSAYFFALAFNYKKTGEIIYPDNSKEAIEKAERIRFLNLKVIHTDAHDHYIWQFFKKAIALIDINDLVLALDREARLGNKKSVTLIDLYEKIYNTSIVYETKLPYLNKNIFPTYEDDLTNILDPSNAIILIGTIIKGDLITF